MVLCLWFSSSALRASSSPTQGHSSSFLAAVPSDLRVSGSCLSSSALAPLSSGASRPRSGCGCGFSATSPGSTRRWWPLGFRQKLVILTIPSIMGRRGGASNCRTAHGIRPTVPQAHGPSSDPSLGAPLSGGNTAVSSVGVVVAGHVPSVDDAMIQSCGGASHQGDFDRNLGVASVAGSSIAATLRSSSTADVGSLSTCASIPVHSRRGSRGSRRAPAFSHDPALLQLHRDLVAEEWQRLSRTGLRGSALLSAYKLAKQEVYHELCSTFGGAVVSSNRARVRWNHANKLASAVFAVQQAEIRIMLRGWRAAQALHDFEANSWIETRTAATDGDASLSSLEYGVGTSAAPSSQHSMAAPLSQLSSSHHSRAATSSQHSSVAVSSRHSRASTSSLHSSEAPSAQPSTASASSYSRAATLPQHSTADTRAAASSLHNAAAHSSDVASLNSASQQCCLNVASWQCNLNTSSQLCSFGTASQQCDILAASQRV